MGGRWWEYLTDSPWLVVCWYFSFARSDWLKVIAQAGSDWWKECKLPTFSVVNVFEGVAVPLSERGRKWIVMAGCMKMNNCFALARFILIIFLFVILPHISHQTRGKKWCPDAPAQGYTQLCGYFSRMSLPGLTNLSCRVAAHFITPRKICSSDVVDIFIFHLVWESNILIFDWLYQTQIKAAACTLGVTATS